MAYICENALPKMPKRLLIEIAENLNQSLGYKISTQQSPRKTIIKSILKEKVGTAQYWNSFDHISRTNLAIIKNDLEEIREGIQKLKS